MPTPRKMLGDVNSPGCRALMELIQTQSKSTLATWSLAFARERYLPVFKAVNPDDRTLDEAILAVDACLAGQIKPAALKAPINAAVLLARNESNPISQAAARAVSTACAVIRTPTNSLGFLFYGAAASAYNQVGVNADADTYARLAEAELLLALESLKAAAIPDEPNPAKIDWNC